MKSIGDIRCGIQPLFRGSVILLAFLWAAINAQAQTVCTDDPNGVEGGAQSDITQICYDATTNFLSFSWDSTSIWNGGNTGDNCVFFDTDGDGNMNTGFCLSIASTGSGAVISAGYPALFTCSDKKPDRCTNPIGPTPTVLSTCTIADEPTDPFGGADNPFDLRAACFLDPSEFGGSIVIPSSSCAFNSSNPNSNASDCIVHNPTAAPALTIDKTGSPTTYAAVGETINYDFVVENTGNTIFDTVSVTDDLIATVSCPALPGAGLTPGQSITCTASYTIASGDPQAGSVTNIAYATGNTTDSPNDSFTVTYNGAPFPDLQADKSVSVWDPAALGLYALPGNDVIYTISVTNAGDGTTTSDSLVLIDVMPGDVEFYNGDIDDTGPETDPVSFAQTGAGLTYSYATDVAYSNSATAPADFSACTYSPSSGYDPNVTYICLNPGGSMAAGDPDPTFSFSFRARIL